MKLLKSETTVLDQIIREGYRHMLRTVSIDMDGKGNVTGEIRFLKLDKKRHCRGMASLSFSGTLQERRA